MSSGLGFCAVIATIWKSLQAHNHKASCLLLDLPVCALSWLRHQLACLRKSPRLLLSCSLNMLLTQLSVLCFWGCRPGCEHWVTATALLLCLHYSLFAPLLSAALRQSSAGQILLGALHCCRSNTLRLSIFSIREVRYLFVSLVLNAREHL